MVTRLFRGRWCIHAHRRPAGFGAKASTSTEWFRYDLGIKPMAVSIDGFKFCGTSAVEVLKLC